MSPNPNYMSRFNTQWKPRTVNDDEVNDMESMTIPDQTMTLREILTRHASGLPLDDGRKVPFYENTDDDDIHEAAEIAEYKKMDLADQQAFRERQALKVQHLQTQLADQQRKDAEFRKKVTDYVDAAEKAETASPSSSKTKKPPVKPESED